MIKMKARMVVITMMMIMTTTMTSASRLWGLIKFQFAALNSRWVKSRLTLIIVTIFITLRLTTMMRTMRMKMMIMLIMVMRMMVMIPGRSTGCWWYFWCLRGWRQRFWQRRCSIIMTLGLRFWPRVGLRIMAFWRDGGGNDGADGTGIWEDNDTLSKTPQKSFVLFLAENCPLKTLQVTTGYR